MVQDCEFSVAGNKKGIGRSKMKPHEGIRAVAGEFTIIIITILLLSSCAKKRNYEKLYFKEKGLLFSCEKIKKSCNACNFKFDFWIGRNIDTNFFSLFSLNGYLYLKNDIIYLKALSDFEPIVLFNFNMKIMSEKKITLKYNSKGFTNTNTTFQKKYILKLDTVFKCHDTNIYKFRFKSINLFGIKDDLVFFVNKYSGIEGVYSSFYESGNEKIITQKGLLYFPIETTGNIP